MKGRRNVALAVGLWVLVVVVGMSLVWGVISRAGRGVAGSDEPLAEQAASSPSGRTSTSAPPSSSPSDSSSSPSAAPSNTTSPRPGSTGRSERRSWQGVEGVVSAECRETSVRLTGAVPRSGYAAEVDDSGPARLRVEFESGDGERRTRVEAVCRSGSPSFTEHRHGGD
jgi:hypothetical protein